MNAHSSRVLITGINGFVGSHLAEHFLGLGAEVHGIRRKDSSLDNIQNILDQVTLHETDLTDSKRVERIVTQIQPDQIYHLAAQSNVAESFQTSVQTYTTNINCQIHLLEAVRKSGGHPKVLIVGSSDEYGLIHSDEIPVKETNPLRPLSPYAVSKVSQDLMGYQYFRNYGLWIIRVRAFNHTGPRRGESYVASNFARQIVMIERGLIDPLIHVGDMEVVRDFTDVRDVVRAYALCLQKGTPGEVYNVCTGKGRKIRYILDTLLKISHKKIRVEVDTERFRVDDIVTLIGDPSKLEKRTGWKPEIPLEKTLEDLLLYWRERLDQKAQGSRTK